MPVAGGIKTRSLTSTFMWMARRDADASGRRDKGDREYRCRSAAEYEHSLDEAMEAVIADE